MEESQKNPLKILYAEDEPALREITTELLRSEGFECVAVSDGREAMSCLHEGNFDLLLTDFRMPHMDGASLLLWCRGNGRHFPVIFVSGDLERLPIETLALEDCCASVLQKPVSFDDLLDEINRALQRRHDFECQSKSYRPEGDRVIKGFQGQHYMEE